MIGQFEMSIVEKTLDICKKLYELSNSFDLEINLGGNHLRFQKNVYKEENNE